MRSSVTEVAAAIYNKVLYALIEAIDRIWPIDHSNDLKAFQEPAWMSMPSYCLVYREMGMKNLIQR